MTDRELLEAAAKAVNGGVWHPLTHDTPNGTWNPLADDGDALRLAVKLGLVVDCSRPSAAPPFHRHTFEQADYTDRRAATRRAIVRAAAAMGEKA